MDNGGLSTSLHHPVNLVLHCASRSRRIVLNAPQPLSPVQQRFPRETHAHAM